MSWAIPPEFLSNLRQAAEAALVLEANAVMEKGKPITPVEKGDLAGSWEVFPPEWSGDTCTVTIGVGGTPETAPYAEEQHERTDLKHAPGKQAKYLEQPANEALVGISDRVAANTIKGMG